MPQTRTGMEPARTEQGAGGEEAGSRGLGEGRRGSRNRGGRGDLEATREGSAKWGVEMAGPQAQAGGKLLDFPIPPAPPPFAAAGGIN